MRKRWYILAALAGSLTTFVVWFWPERPLWQSGAGAGMPEHFSRDGRVLVTKQEFTLEGDPRPTISRWDATTGELLSRVELNCTRANFLWYIRPSSDGTMILTDEAPVCEGTNYSRDFRIVQSCIYDGITGKRRVGPIPGMAASGSFSLDGRWFWGYRVVLRGAELDYLSVIFCSTETGEVIFELPCTEHRYVGRCVFARDSRTVAVEFGTGEPRSVAIVEVPSGQEVGRLELPEGNWSRVDAWDGRYLEVMEEIRDAASGGQLRRSCRFEVSRGVLGEAVEPPQLRELRGGSAGDYFWVAGPGWVASLSVEPPPPAWRMWIASKLGIGQGPVNETLMTVRLMDPATGATRYELPYPVGDPIQISPDGRLLACCGPDASVHVWDLNPPRWPKATALGAVVAGGVLGLGRWRQRARAKSTSAA